MKKDSKVKGTLYELIKNGTIKKGDKVKIVNSENATWNLFGGDWQNPDTNDWVKDDEELYEMFKKHNLYKYIDKDEEVISLPKGIIGEVTDTTIYNPVITINGIDFDNDGDVLVEKVEAMKKDSKVKDSDDALLRLCQLLGEAHDKIMEAQDLINNDLDDCDCDLSSLEYEIEDAEAILSEFDFMGNANPVKAMRKAYDENFDDAYSEEVELDPEEVQERLNRDIDLYWVEHIMNNHHFKTIDEAVDYINEFLEEDDSVEDFEELDFNEDEEDK